MNSYLIPIIRYDKTENKVTIDEIRVPNLNPIYQEYIPTKLRPPSKLNQIEIKKRFLRLTYFAFKIDKTKLVEVRIYIDEEFEKYKKEPERQLIIEKWVQHHAAWFFSYGTRRFEENQCLHSSG